MRLLDYIADQQIAKAMPARKVQMPPGFQPWRSTMALNLLETDERTLIKNFVSTAYSCVGYRRDALAGMDWKFQRRIGPDKVQPLPSDHWFPELWRNPTPLAHIIPSMILKFVETWYSTGQAYLITPLENGDYPTSMFPVPPNTMFPTLGPEGFIEGWNMIGVDGNYTPYKPYEVCYFMEPTPASDVRTMLTSARGWFDAALDDIDSDRAVKDGIREAMTAVFPPWFVKVPTAVTDTQKASFRKQIAEKIKKKGTREPLAFINDNWDIASVDQFKQQRDSQALSMPFQKAICSASGVPMGFFDNIQLNGRVTVETLWYMFMVGKMQTRAIEVCETVNRHFQQFEEGIEMDFTRVDRRDTEAERLEDQYLQANGLATPNQLAKKRGLGWTIPAEQGGDTYATNGVWMPQTLMMQGGAAGLRAAASGGAGVPAITDPNDEQIKPGDEGEPEKKPEAGSDAKQAAIRLAVIAKYGMWDKPSLMRFQRMELHRTVATLADQGDAEALRMYHGAYDGPAQQFSDALQEKLYALFKRLETEVVGNLDKSGSTGLTKREGGDLFNSEEWQKLFAQGTATEVRDHILAVFEQAVDEVGSNWETVGSDFDDARTKALEGSLSKIKEGPSTVHEELKQLLRENSGKSAAEIKDMIRAKFDVYSASRAATIARTTATYATSTSQRSAWKGLDIEYRWLTGTNPRATHQAASNAAPDKAGMFHIGDDVMEHPCSGDLAEENCNCNCVLRARPKK